MLPASRGRQLITVDPVVFGRHFDARVAPRAVGEKLLKRNLITPAEARSKAKIPENFPG